MFDRQATENIQHTSEPGEGDSPLDSFLHRRQTRNHLVSVTSTTPGASTTTASPPAGAGASSDRRRPAFSRVLAWVLLAFLIYILGVMLEGLLIHLPTDTAG